MALQAGICVFFLPQGKDVALTLLNEQLVRTAFSVSKRGWILHVVSTLL